MNFNKQELKEIEKHKDTMVCIVKNHSCSNITIEYREFVKRFAEKFGMKITCSTCNTNLYLATSAIYDRYTEDMCENNKKKTNKDK